MESLYGSHESMVCDDIEQDTIVGVDNILNGRIVLKDEDGYYITDVIRLDDGLADPNRYNARKTR